MPQTTYDLANYDSEEERENNPNAPPLENLASAARYVAAQIKSVGGTYALMGGFSLLMMGSQRPTRDVDMVTTLNMRDIWDLIDGDERLIVPASRQVADIIKLFVKTGPGYDECDERLNIEVDIARPGVKGTPRDISDAVSRIGPVSEITVTLAGQRQEVTFQALNAAHVLKAKLYHNSNRGMERDFEDVIFLLNNHGEEIRQHLEVLNEEDVTTFLESEELDEEACAVYAEFFGMAER